MVIRSQFGEDKFLKEFHFRNVWNGFIFNLTKRESL